MKNKVKRKKICFVGGGTGGHVIPATVVANKFIENDYKIIWIGSKKKKNLEINILKSNLNNFYKCNMYFIPSGKFRRSGSILKNLFNIKNIIDIFNILLGFLVSLIILIKENPDAIFSKGGFVSVPVLVAGSILGKPCFTHESDYTTGLANRINAKFSKKVFYSFPDSIKIESIKNQKERSKYIYTSNPIRKEFFNRTKVNLNIMFNFTMDRPVLFVMGGSLGASRINNFIYKNINFLKENFNIIHQTGKNNLKLKKNNYYYPVEFINENIHKIMQNSYLIISRAGANSVFEIIASKTPAIFIPLKIASRGEQVYNALYFEKRNMCISVNEMNLDIELKEAINKYLDKDFYNTIKSNLDKINLKESEKIIFNIISNYI